MIRRLLTVGMTLCWLSSGAEAENNCSCPNVPADGKGETSCSAAEASGRCTIDFNIFGAEREQRAFNLLRSVTKVPLSLPPVGADSVAAMATASANKQTVEVLLVYLAIAAADQEQAQPGTVGDLGPVISHVNEIGRDAIEKAFDAATAKEFAGTPPAPPGLASGFVILNAGGLTVAPGCVEVRQNDLWLMFKANWSPVALASGCGGQKQ